MKKSIIIFLLVSLLSVSCSTKKKPAEITYLIPENYTGGVLILYSQPDGITPETDTDGNFVLQIPKDGFLKVKPQYEKRWYENKFYYINEAGEKRPIDYIYRDGEFNPKGPKPKIWGSLTEDEMNNGIFAMHYRSIGIDQTGDKIKLYVFSLGHPKDADFLYLRTLDKLDQVREQIYQGIIRP